MSRRTFTKIIGSSLADVLTQLPIDKPNPYTCKWSNTPPKIDNMADKQAFELFTEWIRSLPK